MKTITIINQKGGVGKSTTALAIGAGLSIKGYKVLYVDLDAQGNLSYTLNADIRGYNSLGVLERPKTIKEEIQRLNNVDILASTPNLAGADNIINQTGKEYRLKEALELVADIYDYCIIDTPPALGVVTINALTASTGAIIPAQSDIYSLQGISQLNQTIEAVKRYCNPNLFIMGIVLTRYNKRAIIRREVAEMLEVIAKELDTKLYNTKIRECTALVEAQAMKEDIYTYAPKSNATADYMALVNEILEEVKDNGKENI